MGQRIMMTGNEAAGEGAIRAGCDSYFGYPITPQNELTAYMARHMPLHNLVFVQAESELAAINMVFGAAAAGKRSMTSSSSPGISLKQEGLSYLAGAELPMVLVNVQRGGPGLGNIMPSQSDYFQAVKGGGHGDYRMIVLAPASVQEMHDFTAMAFDLADKYRNPVMVLSDGRLGQMMEPLKLWSAKPNPPRKPWALTGAQDRKQNIIRSFFNTTGVLEERNRILQAKFRRMEEEEIRFDGLELEDAEILFVAFGTSARLCKEVVQQYRNDGIAAGLLRPITLWPFPAGQIARQAERARLVFVVEMNAGQMLEDVRLACGSTAPVRFFGRLGGGVPTTRQIRAAADEALAGQGHASRKHGHA